MKIRKLLLALLLSTMSFSSFSQYYENVVEIDRVTGNHIHNGSSIPNVILVSARIRTYNSNNAIFFFISNTPSVKLFSIEVSNDSVLCYPFINNNVSEIEFSNSLNTLFGILQDSPNNQKKFVSIDPTTGNFSVIGNSISSSSMYQGYSTFDQNNNIYIAKMPTEILYSIDAINGTVISSPALLLAPNEDIFHIVYDNSTNILYGLLRDNNINKYFLVKINLSTGFITRIGNGTSYGVGGGSAAIDEANQQYIYIYSNGTGGYDITTLDILTGELLYQNTFPDCGGIKYNFINLEYDNVRHKLYAMHWDEYTLSATINSTNVICNGQSNGSATANINNCNTPFTYNWSTTPVQNSQTATGLCAGNYTVTITDGQSISTTASVTITEPPAMQDSIRSNNITCSGDSSGNALVMASGGTPGYTYNWSNGDTTKNINGLAAGTYFVTITDANGCTIKDSVTITSVPLPVPVIAPDTNNFTLQCTPSYNSYQWYYNGIAISGATAQSYSPVQNGNYTVEVTDSNGCTGFSAGYNVVWVGIAEYKNPAGLSIKPNPATSVLNMELPNSCISGLFRIYDILGTEIIKKSFSGNKIIIDISRLPKGLYLLRVESGEENYVKKFVKE